jgi:hypothetical protein
MRRSHLVFAVLVLSSASPAFGQYVAVIQACSRDTLKFCHPAQPEGGQLTECIKGHFQDLSEPCKAALARVTEVRKACGDDIQQQCPAVKPSAGRVVLCVKRHFASLSDPCKDAIGHAAERRLQAH